MSYRQFEEPPTVARENCMGGIYECCWNFSWELHSPKLQPADKKLQAYKAMGCNMCLKIPPPKHWHSDIISANLGVVSDQHCNNGKMVSGQLEWCLYHHVICKHIKFMFLQIPV